MAPDVKALYAEDLHEATCDSPGCSKTHEDTLFLRARCHPTGRISVSYSLGIMTVLCKDCGKLIANVAVASRRSITVGADPLKT